MLWLIQLFTNWHPTHITPAFRLSLSLGHTATPNGCNDYGHEKTPMLMALPLELIDHILTFLFWPHDLHPLLLVRKSLNSIAKRYDNIPNLPSQYAVRLFKLLLLENAPATWCELLKSLLLNFIKNRVLFALELLIAKVLRRLLQLRSLSIGVSIHKHRHCALAWIFPTDAPFRLSLFATSIM